MVPSVGVLVLAVIRQDDDGVRLRNLQRKAQYHIVGWVAFDDIDVVEGGFILFLRQHDFVGCVMSRITTGRWSVTIPLCTSRIQSSARGDQLHSTRWSDISRLGTSRLLSERSIRIDATLAVNKPARATPTTSTPETTSRPRGVLGALLRPLKRVTQTFQRDSRHVPNA